MGGVRRRWGLMTAAVLVSGAIAGCGSDGSANQDKVRQAREEGARSARQEDRLKQLEKEVHQSRTKPSTQAPAPAPNPAPSAGGAPPSTASCGGGVSVGPGTSCAFARNVQAAFNAHGGGDVSVFSPTTGQTYVMNCTVASGTVCVGGRHAVVYLP